MSKLMGGELNVRAHERQRITSGIEDERESEK